MKFALFRCCTTSIGLKEYESATDAVLEKLEVGIVAVKEFNCCGYPLKNYNFPAYILSSARNLAIAEARELDVLTVCNCCYGSLKQAEHILQENTPLKERVNSTLKMEGLTYNGRSKPVHLLQVLHDEITVERIASSVNQTFQGLRVAVHYGCHILRPREIIQFDSPFSPTKLDRLVEVTGARSVPWTTKLQCCGSSLLGVNDSLSRDLAEKKLASARKAQADYLCVVCPYCRYQFDRVQNMMTAEGNAAPKLPTILYHQLLGLSLGIDEKLLGLSESDLPSVSDSVSVSLYRSVSG